jgi:hypothetical protein
MGVFYLYREYLSNMEKNIVIEEQIQNILNKVLNEETSKVKREEYGRVQYKMDELQNSLNETIKELRQLEDSVPEGLKTLTKGRLNSLSMHLSEANKLLSTLKFKVKSHKKITYSQSIEEKKK